MKKKSTSGAEIEIKMILLKLVKCSNLGPILKKLCHEFLEYRPFSMKLSLYRTSVLNLPTLKMGFLSIEQFRPDLICLSPYIL